MSDFHNLIEQPSEDRMDVVVYAGFTRDNRLGEIISEKEYMATEGCLNAVENTMFELAHNTGISMEAAANAFANVAVGRP